MSNLINTADYLFLLQIILSQIPWGYFLNLEDDVNLDTQMSDDPSIDYSLNGSNSSFKTINELDENESKVENSFSNKRYLIEENDQANNDHSTDLNCIYKRNSDVQKEKEKGITFKNHNEPSQLTLKRTEAVRRQGEGAQRRIKLNEIKKKHENPSFYENSQINKHKSNLKYNVEKGYNGSKTILKEQFNDVKLSFGKKRDNVFDKENPSKEASGSNDNNDITINNRGKVEQDIIHNKFKLGIERKKHFTPQNRKKFYNESSNFLFSSASFRENKNKSTRKLRHGKLKKLTKEIQNNEKPHSAMSELTFVNGYSGEERFSHLKKNRISNFLKHKRQPGNLLGKSNKDNDIFHGNSKRIINRDFSVNVQNDENSGETFECDENSPLLSKKNGVSSYEEENKNHAQKFQKENTLINRNSKDKNVSSKNKKRKRHQNNQNLNNAQSFSFDTRKKFLKTKIREHYKGNKLEKREYTNNIEADSRLSDTSKRNQRDTTRRIRKHDSYLINEPDHNKDDYSDLSSSGESDDSNDSALQIYDENIKAKEDISSNYKNRKFNTGLGIKNKQSYKETQEEDPGFRRHMDSSRSGFMKNPFSRRSHRSRQKDDEPQIKEKCVGYKAEIVTKKPAYSTDTPTETCSTKDTKCSTIQTVFKTKTTSQTHNKLKTTINVQYDSKKSKSNNETIDIFEQYLCGQLADDFFDAVMAKIKRSRKLYKELGFRNDSDDTCDRCIETKPSNIPNEDTMKIFLGKCIKNSEYKLSCRNCYSVPKPMEMFLNLLFLYEKEFANSIYTKIRDDSSFIFTGDYPEQFNSNVNSIGSDNKFAFSKETLEKESLRDDRIEEKHNDEAANREVPNDENNTQETENVHSTKTEENDEENGLPSASKIISNNGVRHRATISTKNSKSSYETEENLERNDLDNEIYRNSPLKKIKYSSVEDEPSRSENTFKRVSNKQRRKALKSDKMITDRKTYITEKYPEYEVEGAEKARNIGERSYAYVDKTPSRSRFGFEKQLVPDGHSEVSLVYDDKTSQRQKHSYQYKSRPSFSHSNRFPFNPALGQMYKNNHEHYDRSRLRQQQNDRHSAVDGFMSTDWGDREYELLPNQPREESFEDNIINTHPKKRLRTADYEERLNMVKRESEPPYEDEPLFFEIPNIEYDLY